MTNQKISQLPTVTTATGSELIPVVQAGTTKQATLAQLLAVLVAGAPAALDTLKEIADAFGDDPNYAADIVTQLAAKADAASVAATYVAKPAGGSSGQALVKQSDGSIAWGSVAGGGTSITDNGDGTFTASGSSVTDNGDGTFTIAA